MLLAKYIFRATIISGLVVNIIAMRTVEIMDSENNLLCSAIKNEMPATVFNYNLLELISTINSEGEMEFVLKNAETHPSYRYVLEKLYKNDRMCICVTTDISCAGI